MKKSENDKLRSLFNNIKLNEPSADFENQLMRKILLAEKKITASKRMATIIAITAGIIAILGIPSALFYFLGWSVDLKNIMPDMSSLKVNPLTLSISVVILLLLFGDTIVRKHIWHKKFKNTQHKAIN